MGGPSIQMQDRADEEALGEVMDGGQSVHFIGALVVSVSHVV
jgi:hypothetical protein